MAQDIDLNLLAVFDAVMSERNLRRAGERLNRSQPAISQAVARLRDVTGDRLFDRSPTGVVPTARAERLWAEIRDPLSHLREAMGTSPFDPARAEGEVAVALSDDARILVWPAIARAVLEAAPRLTLRAISTNHTSVWEDLTSGRADLALSVAGQPPPGLGTRILHQDGFVLLHRADAAPPRTARDYATRRHLALVFSREQPAYADEALDAAGESRRVAVRSDRFDALPDLVEALDAVVALPSLIAAHFASSRPLAVSDLPVPFPPAITKLCWSQKRRNDAQNAWLRDAVFRAAEARLEALAPR